MDATIIRNGSFYAEYLYDNVWNVYEDMEGDEDHFVGPTANPTAYLSACVAGDWEAAKNNRYTEYGCDLPPGHAIDLRWREAPNEHGYTVATYDAYLVSDDPKVFGKRDEDDDSVHEGFGVTLAKLRNSKLFEED